MKDWNKDDSSSDDDDQEEELTGIEGENNPSETANMLKSSSASNGSVVRLRKCDFCKIKVRICIIKN